MLSRFSLLEATAIGTADVMAAMAVLRLEDAGLAPDAGSVAVIGASGGAGSIATALLAVRDYEVTTFTGRRGAGDYLISFDTACVEPRPNMSGKRPLEKDLRAEAIDAVDGDTLIWLTRTAALGAPIAAFGNAGGNVLNATMLPFILQGVSLLEVTVAFPSDDVRKRTWQILTDSLKAEAPRAITSEIAFGKLEPSLFRVVEGGVRGRVVVRMSEEGTFQSP